MKNIIKFTKESYPNGYSRQDCMDQLATVENHIILAKGETAGLAAEAEELSNQLKQGGLTKE
jgi:hypothetical protein